MLEQTTLAPKTAVEMAKQIVEAINRGRIPVIIADQPALAHIIADHATDDPVTINSVYTDSAVMKALVEAAAHKNTHRKVGHILIMKADKAGAGTFSGKHFVKIISKRLFITVGSVANLLVGED